MFKELKIHDKKHRCWGWQRDRLSNLTGQIHGSLHGEGDKVETPLRSKFTNNTAFNMRIGLGSDCFCREVEGY